MTNNFLFLCFFS